MAEPNVMLTPILALDVGNGYGKVSILTDWSKEPEIMLPAALYQGMDTTAYVAPDGTIEVYAARRRASRAVRAVKTRLDEPAIYLEERGTRYQVAPDAVYAAIAKDMARLANRELLARKKDGVYDVVLTYPASFAHRHDLLARLKQSVESVELDGRKLKVLHMLSEPSAIAVDYLHYICHRAQDPVKAEQHTVLVYDLGHGTFDAAVVTAYADPKKECELHSQDGDPEVGGRIFDELLYNELCAQLRQKVGYEPKTAERREQIRQLASEMKHALSEQNVVEREVTLPDEDVPVQITRERFEALIAPCLQNTWQIVHNQMDEAQKRGVKVDAIVMSGGSSRIPYIEQQLKTATGGSVPVMIYKPSMAVCFGAARYGAARIRQPEPVAPPSVDLPEPQPVPRPGRTVLTQHADRAYGFWVPDETLAGHILYMIDSKDTLPCWSKTAEVVTSATGSTKLWLYCSKEYVTGAETGAVADCDQILQVRFELQPNTSIRVSMHMNEDRSIKLSCQMPDGKIYSQTVFGGDAAGKES